MFDDPRMILVRQYLAEIYTLPVEAIAPEFFDFLKIVTNGAKKYAMNNWLEPTGKSVSQKEMSDHMFHHLAEYYSGSKTDHESKEHPLLHLQCRAAMRYTRDKRGIKDE